VVAADAGGRARVAGAQPAAAPGQPLNQGDQLGVAADQRRDEELVAVHRPQPDVVAAVDEDVRDPVA
jgi:hypothetical protein